MVAGRASETVNPQSDAGWVPPERGSDYAALGCGNVGLRALFTDTVDSPFAMDVISLTIVTDTEMIESYYG